MIVSEVLGVLVSSNLIVDVKIKFVVSGSTITSVTEATEYFFKSFTILSFVESVKLEPLVNKIERYTRRMAFQSSPTSTLTDCVLA